jgi:hypothetical protein
VKIGAMEGFAQGSESRAPEPFSEKGSCRALHKVANAPYLSRFLFPHLHVVAPYFVPNGVRVVSRGVWILYPT